MRLKYSFRFTSLLPTLTIFCLFVGLSIFVACTSCQYVNGILSSFVTYCFTSDFTVFQSTLCKKRSEPAFASAEICKTTNSCLRGRFCALPTFFFKIRPSDLTSRNWHDILIAVDGALAQLVAHNTGSVGVRSSNLLCSTIFVRKAPVFVLFSCIFCTNSRPKRVNKGEFIPYFFAFLR